MSDSEHAANSTVNRCQVCQEKEAIYKCPRCLKKTCSLICAKKHKAVDECIGTRDKTAYVAVKEFTDRHLLNDYRFLEDASRKTESALRDDLRIQRFQPHYVKKLLNHAREQGIKLQVLPYPMSKRKQNSSMYNKQLKTILWHIEWVFPQAEAKYIDKRVPESLSLREASDKFLHPTESDPVIRQKLRHYCQAGADNYQFLLRAEMLPSNSTWYHPLEASKSIRENLRGKEVLEYPSIHIILNDKIQEYDLIHTDKRSGSLSQSTELVQSIIDELLETATR